MSFPGHPFPPEPHPWTDLRAFADPAIERPDQAIQTAGAFAPPPDSFSFDERGRQEYYASVRTTALMIEQQRAATMIAAHHATRAPASAEPAGSSAPTLVTLQLLLL